MPKPKYPKSRKPSWFVAGDGVQGIGGGWHSRRRFRQPPQGKSGPVIRSNSALETVRRILGSHSDGAWFHAREIQKAMNELRGTPHYKFELDQLRLMGYVLDHRPADDGGWEYRVLVIPPHAGFTD